MVTTFKVVVIYNGGDWIEYEYEIKSKAIRIVGDLLSQPNVAQVNIIKK